MPELAEQFTPRQSGQVIAYQVDGGWQFRIGVRHDLDPEDAESFAQWVRTAIAQLLETNDPVSNGWYPGEKYPGVWRLTATSREMPPDPFA